MEMNTDCRVGAFSCGERLLNQNVLLILIKNIYRYYNLRHLIRVSSVKQRDVYLDLCILSNLFIIFHLQPSIIIRISTTKAS